MVFCGHAHHAEHKKMGEINYYNSGTMQSNVVTCVTLSEKGVRIYLFERDDSEAKVINAA